MNRVESCRTGSNHESNMGRIMSRTVSKHVDQSSRTGSNESKGRIMSRTVES